MAEYELPLVIFTVLSQWAVGITIAVALLEWLKPKFMGTTANKTMKTPIFISFGLSVVAALASMTHLNNPFKSYTSLIGTGHSWLSREIITVIIFNVFLMALVYVWWKKSDEAVTRRLIGTLTAIAGVVLVVASATVYFSIRLHPTWNNWTTFANFLLTGFLLGALTVSYYALKASKEEADTGVMKFLGSYLGLIILALLVTLGSSAMISNGAAESQIAATTSFTSLLFWLRVFGSLMIPATLVLYMISSKKLVSMKYVLVATAFVLVGELSGRAIFYYSVMSQYPWF